jgi:general secretion pathway protein L
MVELFILQCHDISCDQVSWCVKGTEVSEVSQGTLADAAQQARGRRTLILIPASEVLITQVRIPTRNRQRLLQAIPFSLENELTEDIDDLHFAAGNINKDNITPVIIITKSKLEHWLECFESAGIEPLGLYVDALCLPREDDSTCWSLYLDERFMLIHSQEHQGFSTDIINADLVFRLARQQAEENPPQKLLLYQHQGVVNPLDLNDLPPECEVITQAIAAQSQLTTLLSTGLNESKLVNLLQGDYLRVDKTTLKWKRWLPVAILGLVVIGLSMAMTIKDYFYYDQQNIALKQEIESVFRQAFPNIKRIVDPRVQMEQELKKLQGSGRGGNMSQFADLFVPAAQIVHNSANTTLDNISFRNGKLDLQLIIKDLEALDNLKKTLEGKKLNVDIRSANATGNQVTSHLRISGG